MNKYIQRLFQIVVLLTLIVFLGMKWLNGKLALYINMRFSPLIIFAILGLALMALTGIWGLRGLFQKSVTLVSPSEAEDHGVGVVSGFAIFILTIPLLLGVLVPERPLSSKSLGTRGMSLTAPGSLDQKSMQKSEAAPDDRTVLDWIKIFNYESDVTPYLQQPANVIGFVYHDPRLSSGQFMVGRFAIVCCVADAFAIGMAVDWPDSANLQDNVWVNVKGPVDILTIDGRKIPLIHAKAVTPVTEPGEPYLYP